MKVKYNGMEFEGFEIEGEEFTYPFSFCDTDECRKENYRETTRRQIQSRKCEEAESKLPVSYRLKRSMRNFGLEFSASALEAIVCLLNCGHVVRFDEIRDMKEIPYRKESFGK